MFGHTFSWIEELSQYIMIWLAFFGSVLCIPENGHVGVDVITNMLPRRLLAYYSLFLNTFSCAFLTWFSYTAVRYFLVVHNAGHVTISMTWMPRSFIYMAGALALPLMVVEYAKLIVKLILEMKRGVHRSKETDLGEEAGIL